MNDKPTPLRNLLEVTSLVSMLIYLSLMLLAWTAPNLSTRQVLNEYGLVFIIGIMPGWISLRRRT
jgi:positive regulator of sigma E activity